MPRRILRTPPTRSVRLPPSPRGMPLSFLRVIDSCLNVLPHLRHTRRATAQLDAPSVSSKNDHSPSCRSEERRVGKSVSVRVDLGGRRIIKKKKHKIKLTITIDSNNANEQYIYKA